jgi:hypothetical protein
MLVLSRQLISRAGWARVKQEYPGHHEGWMDGEWA